MKRCPQCKRVETDDALVFCRADGTPLVNDSGSVSAEGGTAKFVSSPAASEIETSVLPQHATDAGMSRATGPTTVLDRQQTIGRTHELSKPKWRRPGVVVGCALLIILSITAVVIGTRYFSKKSAANETSLESIAVLPFVNVTADPNTEYLADGVTDSLIYDLSKLSGLKVKSHSSVFRYKGKDTDPQTVGKDLGVQAVLTGRITQRGDGLVINTELVEVGSNNVLWGQQYNRRLSDAQAVQSEIAKEVSAKLRLKLAGGPQGTNNPVSPEAYQAYLKGRYYYLQFTEESEQKAIEHFNQAISLDPNYARAFAGLALVYTEISSQYVPPSEAMPKAKQAVLRALALDGSLADAHLALAEIHWWSDWDFPAAELEFRRAIELNSNEPSAYSDYAMFLARTLGRSDEAIVMADRALQLDSLSLAIHNDVAFTFYYARQYDRVAQEANKMLELDHNSVHGSGWLGAAYLQKGQYEQAIPELQKAVDPHSGDGLDRLGYAYALAGRKSEALKTLAQMEALSERKYVSPYAIARVYSGLGEKERVFRWLEKAYAGGDDGLTKLKTDPIFDSLHSDPRFTDLARRIGLPQ